MPKETKTIDNFAGGRNDIVDPRDMAEGDFAEFVNLSNSQSGVVKIQGTVAMPVHFQNAWGVFKRLKMSQASGGGGWFGYSGIEATQYGEAGDALSRDNRLNCQNFSNGYGLFTFLHDYNYGIDGYEDVAEIPTEFIAYGDGKWVNIFDGQAPDNTTDDLSAHHYHVLNFGADESSGANTNVWHNFDWGAGVLRAYDSNESNWAVNRPQYLAHVARQYMTRTTISGNAAGDIKDNLTVNRWGKGEVNLKQPKDAISSEETSDNPSGISTNSTDGTGDAEGFTFIPLTVVKSGVNYGLGEVSFNTSVLSGYGTTYVGDDDTQIQGHNPTGGMQVLLEFDEQDSLEKPITGWSSTSTGYWSVTVASHGFSAGQQLIINGTDRPALNTAYEIYGITDANTFVLENEYADDAPTQNGTASLNINAIDDAIRTKWVFGISWLYDDGMETPVSMGYLGTNGQPGGTGGGNPRGGKGTLMSPSNTIDFTSYSIQPKVKMSFLYNPSASSPFEQNGEGDSANRYRAGWGLRCNGFRVYMKDVITGSVSSEWMLLGEVDFINGEYIIAAGANEWQALQYCGWHSDITDTPNTEAEASIPSTKIRFRTGLSDTLEGLPAETFTILNGYDPDVTTNVLYKTGVTNNRVRYVGNVMVPDKRNIFYDITGGHTGEEQPDPTERGQAWRNASEVGRRYPDRIMKSPPGQMDIFPNDGLHFIDVASNDGDSITHLACFADRLLQFKDHKVYTINVSNPNDEYLEGEFKHAGIIHPCQICETPTGLVWANDVGIFQFTGEAVTSLSLNKFNWHTLKDSTLGTAGSLTQYYIHPTLNYVTNPPVVGYDRGSQKVIILLGGQPDGNHLETQYNGGFIYDMRTKSMTQVKDIAHRQYTCGISNMRVMADGTLIYAYKPLYDATGVSTGFAPDNIATVVSDTTFISQYTDTADFGTSYEAISDSWGNSTTPRKWGVMQDDGLYGVEFKTQDFALGDPAQRKKLYKVYITYRSLGTGKYDSGNATNDWGNLTTGTENTWNGALTTQSNSSIRVKYFINGDTSTPLSFTAIDNCTDSGDSTELDGAKTDWSIAALKPRTSSQANNIKSIQLWFYTEGRRYCDKDFQINDITLVFRKKSIK